MHLRFSSVNSTTNIILPKSYFIYFIVCVLNFHLDPFQFYQIHSDIIICITMSCHIDTPFKCMITKSFLDFVCYSHPNVTLIWVPEYILGNSITNELPGRKSDISDILLVIGIANVSVYFHIIHSVYREAQSRWQLESMCNISRLCLKYMAETRRLTFNFKPMPSIAQLLFSRATLLLVAMQKDFRANEFCWNCESEKEEETVIHLILSLFNILD